MPQRYFLDTSALLARYLRGTRGHAWVVDLSSSAQANTLALAQITAVELAASCNQMVRGGTVQSVVCNRALTAFWAHFDGGEYDVIPANLPLIRRAAALCNNYSLRGYDAVQLAAALTFRDDTRIADTQSFASGAPIFGDPILLTEDKQPAASAAAEGFTVDSPLNHP